MDIEWLGLMNNINDLIRIKRQIRIWDRIRVGAIVTGYTIAAILTGVAIYVSF